MKGFRLKDGDLVLSYKQKKTADGTKTLGQIEMIEGSELTLQKVQNTLRTNQGEWVLNAEEGINFNEILGKHNAPIQSQTSGALKAQKALYDSEIDRVKENENELAKKLEERLEGR